MMTLLPVLPCADARMSSTTRKGEPKHRAQIEALWLKRPGIVLAITILLCGIAATQLGKVRFDYNILALQSTSLASVQTEEKLIKSAGQSLLYGAATSRIRQRKRCGWRGLHHQSACRDVGGVVGGDDG